jgi:L-lactate permease
MKSTRSLPAAAAILFVLRLAYFGSSPLLVCAAIIQGAIDMLTPISVIFGAMFLFETMGKSGAMDWIILQLKNLSKGHPIAQIMLLGWTFNVLIEGASGFGTPVMLAAPILRELGHDPIGAVCCCLLFNSLATIFGAAGTTIWFGFGGLGLTEQELLGVGFRTQIGIAAAALLGGVPIICLLPLVPFKTILRNFIFIYLSILSVQVPALGLSYVSYELPTLIAGLIGLFITALLVRFNVGLKPETLADISPESDFWSETRTATAVRLQQATLDKQVPELGDPVMLNQIMMNKDKNYVDPNVFEDPLAGYSNPEPMSPMYETVRDEPLSEIDIASTQTIHTTRPSETLVREPVKRSYILDALVYTFPLWATIIFLVITRIPQLGIRNLLTATSPSATAFLGTLGQLTITASITVSLTNILTVPTAASRYQTLFVPAWLPFAIMGTLGVLLLNYANRGYPHKDSLPGDTWFKRAQRQLHDSFFLTLSRMGAPVIALLGANILVALLKEGGTSSPAYLLGSLLATWMGKSWLALVVLLGALGSFFSGSTTVSNLTFGPVQLAASQAAGLGTMALLAMSCCGASMGNAVCIANVLGAKTVMVLSPCRCKVANSDRETLSIQRACI